MRISIMGVQFDDVTMDDAVAKAEDLLDKPPRGAYCVTPNAEIVYEAMRDPAFCALLNQADLVLPDGAGVVLGSKILKTPLRQKVAGIDFASRLLAVLARRGQSLYLLGGKPGIGELAAERMRQQYPALQIVGIADGYYQDEDAAVQAIRRAKPDVLFVCLGAPKQERFMAAHQNELPVRLMAGLGGSLDGFAGTVKRAPKWMIRLQLEWLYRLIREPKRFGRMLRLPKFVWATVKERMKG